ncbi:MAG: DUF3408 domain-containing protein [Bacteroidales bacterium]|jgi:hypothetical protein|nr:DUF3408 domain-containing protein [Bacteroidales bacterium]
MVKGKREIPDIDEAALIMSVYEQNNPPMEIVKTEKVENPLPEQAEKPKEAKETKEPVRRKRGNADYSSLFLQRNELKVRSCVYISQRIHNTISEIVRVIADKDVTVGGYIDSVLLQHLETHKDEINDLYKRERKDLIEF